MAGNEKFIRIVGARQHNLKNVTVDIPRDRLTVITGLSGSGKSSLAFDTLYAEGQRRYVESLSTNARQFLEQMQKPDLDRIEGLPPTVAIEQRTVTTNPRSTVATVTEIHDYLRVLFARVGQPHCWICGNSIARQTTGEIVDTVLTDSNGQRIMILAPILDRQAGTHKELLEKLIQEGYVRARIDGRVRMLEDVSPLAKDDKHTIEVVLDRLTVRRELMSRLAESIEMALGIADGRVTIAVDLGNDKTQDSSFGSRYGCSDHPQVSLPELSPNLFSFNSPAGACEACNGLGNVLEFDRDLIISNPELSLATGALSVWSNAKKMSGTHASIVREFCDKFKVSPDIPFRNVPAGLAKILLDGTSRAEAKQYGTKFEGVIPYLKRQWDNTDSETVKQRLHAFLSEAPCQACQGGRLRKEALAVKIDGRSIADVEKLVIGEARAFFDQLRFEGEHAIISDPLLQQIRHRLNFLCDVGVEYLSLDRPGATLSGGESQRIRLATQIGSGLVGVCYCLDEPTIGLHQRDSARLLKTLRRLVDMGNTTVVVEHDEDLMLASDHIIDMGPGAGAQGGRVVAEGPIADILRSEVSLTGKYLSGRFKIPIPEERRPMDPSLFVEIRGAREHNLKNINVKFPLGVFICVTGVSGSGKSTLVSQILLRALHRQIIGSGSRPGAFDRIVGGNKIDKVIEIDQSPIGRSPRSNPATYVGVFDLIRQLYAKTREARPRGYGPNRFSFNAQEGRCGACQGQGTKRIEMHFLPDVFVTCAVCKGTRYGRETLEVKYRGKSIADVLEMRADEAAGFFDQFPKIRQLLRSLLEVGLGYITLGQSSTTLSGGEAQRVKLAAELGKSPTEHTLYILDEPTTGLHVADIHSLLNVLNRLVSVGHSMVVIEHNLEVIKVADWIIDLGPEGGQGGGEVVAVGRPEDICRCERSHTGRYLKSRLSTDAVLTPGQGPVAGRPAGRALRK